jgi:hypothetical protein
MINDSMPVLEWRYLEQVGPFARSLQVEIQNVALARLVIGTSRTFGSAKKFVRITSGLGGGEFTKTLRKVCTWNFFVID